MLQKVYSAFFRSVTILALLAGSQLLPNSAHAQSRVIDFWSFNTFTNDDTLGQYIDSVSDGVNCRFILNNRIRPVSPEYSIISTTTAQLWYQKLATTSAYWPEPSYDICFTFLDEGTGTTTNWPASGFGAATAGNYLRPRNPSDSMELRFYIPTTNYQDITFSYAAEASSTTSGPKYMVYDYSLDSGVTWHNSGLSMTVSPALTAAFVTYSISVTDPLASNNPKFAFRIRDSLQNNTNSGNIRYDNVVVAGDTVIIPQTLIYFWDFNSLPSSYVWGPFTGPATGSSPFPYINPDYTHPGFNSANAKVHMDYYPTLADSMSGIDAASTYFDDVAQVTADYDSVNSNWPMALAPVTTFSVDPVPAGYGIRPRNPLDSTYLYYFMPTTNYKNILLKYATQTSSLTSGDSIQTFNYSVDGGATWRLSGISEAYDSAYLASMGSPSTIPYRTFPITIQFTDPAANNCSGLVFRIGFKGRTGNTTGASGNNRFDNISVQGDSIIEVLPTITTTPIALGPFCASASNNLSVAFTTTGVMTGSYAVQLTNSNGTFPTNTTSNIIGTGTTSPISATIPALYTAAGTNYRVRVVNSYPTVYGSDNGTDIVISSAVAAIGGPSAVCTAANTALSESSTGGVWSSTNTSFATIGSATGIVTGLTAGTTVISYSVGAGCNTSETVTVVTGPAPVTGLSIVCPASSITLSDATASGTWSTATTAVATVGSGTGVVTGATVGTAYINYTISNGCFSTQTVTINPLPSAITGTTSTACVNGSLTLSDAGGGTWSSSNNLLATVGSATGIVTGVGGGNPVITYTLPVTGCIATVSVTINPLPAAISGTNACVGTTTDFTDATAFGAWSSSNPTVASIGSASGVVTGGTGIGTVNISYTLSTGCYTTNTVAVNPLPGAIAGASAAFCEGANTSLSDATAGGTWSSSNFALATVNVSTGVVTGEAAGSPVISYTLSTGCYMTVPVTVNPLPTITGNTSVYCIGSTANLSDATLGGVWTSSNTGIAVVGLSSGIVTGEAAGSAIITYTAPSTCIATLNENISSTPAIITGSANACEGTTISYTDSTAFGVWTSSNSSIAAIGSGNGLVYGNSLGTTVITYELSPVCLITKSVTVNPLPGAISGVSQVCVNANITLSDAAGGTWTTSVPALATVGITSGVVTGLVASGPTGVVISYTLPTGCASTATVITDPLPVITGSSTICVGAPTSLSSNISGGVWTSSNTGVAVINSGSGVMSAVSLGNTTVTNTAPVTGCVSTEVVTVSPPPGSISGATQICSGFTSTLSDAGGGGWYSSVPGVATIGFGTGVVSAVSVGTTVISYTLGTSCITTASLTVNQNPGSISGILSICPGLVTNLTDAIAGGTWSISNNLVATVGLTTGVITGVSAGTPTVTYQLPDGCKTITGIIVNAVAPITGAAPVCSGSIITLSNSVSGGTWSSNNTALATVSIGTGIVTGIGSGTPGISYTLPTGCIAAATITVNPLPSSVTGNTNVCIGSTTSLSDVTVGGTWSSTNTSVATISSAGMVTSSSVGTSNIIYALPTGCVTASVVTVNPLPATITGIPNVCLGTTATLSDITAGGTWSATSSSIASVIAGTGVVSGMAVGSTGITYILPSGCSASVSYTVNPLPSVDTVTGGGSYCGGGTGVTVGLNGSATGINYQLYNGSTAIGSTVSGTGSAISFGLETAAGIYTVMATNATTGCASYMIDSAIIAVKPIPNINTMTGGGHYCVGDTGVHVGLGGSDTGVYYQLYRGGTTSVGSAMLGTGLPLNFGLETIPGIYTVIASNHVTTCTSDMVGADTVTIDSAYAPVVAIAAHPSASILAGTPDTLDAIVADGGPSLTYQWIVNSSPVAGANTSTYISSAFANNDSVTCQVVAHSTCGDADAHGYAKITVTNVGVQQVVSEIANLVLIPNPNKGVFTVKGTLGTINDEDVDLTVTDMLGNVIYRSSVMANNGNLNQVISLSSSLANGMYILSVNSGSVNKAFHFVLEQ